MRHQYLPVAIWIGLLVLAYPYVLQFRHPDAKPIAAYLIFVTVFSAGAAFLFFGLLWLTGILGLDGALTSITGSAIYFALVFIPAFLIAHWQLGRPPTQPPAI